MEDSEEYPEITRRKVLGLIGAGLGGLFIKPYLDFIEGLKVEAKEPDVQITPLGEISRRSLFSRITRSSEPNSELYAERNPLEETPESHSATMAQSSSLEIDVKNYLNVSDQVVNALERVMYIEARPYFPPSTDRDSFKEDYKQEITNMLNIIDSRINSDDYPDSIYDVIAAEDQLSALTQAPKITMNEKGDDLNDKELTLSELLDFYKIEEDNPIADFIEEKFSLVKNAVQNYLNGDANLILQPDLMRYKNDRLTAENWGKPIAQDSDSIIATGFGHSYYRSPQ